MTGRRRAVAALVVLGLAGLTACSSEGTELTEAALRGEVAGDDAFPADDAGDAEVPEGTQPLASRSYDVGDCVVWEDDLDTVVDTRVVDCGEPHRIQITGKHLVPYSEVYPAPEVWEAVRLGECRIAAEGFLGHPLDPYGRFVVEIVHPMPDGWAASSRTVWCGLGSSRGLGSEREPVIGDARDGDQANVFAPGDCLALHLQEGLTVVTCDQPHQHEVTGEVDLGDLSAPPADDEVAERCTPVTEHYLGGPPRAPWDYGYMPVAPESWTAGTRRTTCFVAQWGTNGNPMLVTGSARD